MDSNAIGMVSWPSAGFGLARRDSASMRCHWTGAALHREMQDPCPLLPMRLWDARLCCR